MPVIKLPYNELELLTKADKDSILGRIAMIGADVDKIEADHAAVEFFPDRPDMFSVEGVARAMRGFMDIETGLAEYNVSESDVSITVEPSVLPIRPWIVCAIVRGVDLSYDEAIESIMGLQEDLHWGLGRNRRKVSIGVHDISGVKPPFRYLAVDTSFEFTPLDYDYDMDMREILEKHPKGVKFSFILDGIDKYPIILDS
jgi:phenylalanyl-tRNA synthetase beta chain